MRRRLDPRRPVRAAREQGYLSARHVAGLRAHGPSERHRRSFHIRALDV